MSIYRLTPKNLNKLKRFPLKEFCVSLSSNVSARNFINVVEDEKKKTANVIMQRPPVNSLNTELLQQLTSTIKALEEKKFKGFILSSSSPTVFSAGLDITEMYSPQEEKLRLFWTSLQNMWKTLYMTPLISIAAINGHCPAGGCVLALSCDHSIMVKSRATIGLNETKLGIIAPKWFSQLYINTLNFQKAEHALKLGQLFTPEEALKLQLVNDLVDSPSDLNEKCQSEMERWLKIPDAARRLAKQSLRKKYVDELITYEKQEVEEIVKFVFLDETQNALGAYIKSLKESKK